MYTANKNNKKGVALFVSLTVMLLLSLVVIAILLVAFNYSDITENQIKRLEALRAAEAGVAFAYSRIRYGFYDPVFFKGKRCSQP